jgi:hypothetical protein
MQILMSAEMSFPNFSRWITNMSHSARKNRLKGWRYFYEYCEDTQTSVTRLEQTKHPNYIVTDFISYMTDANFSPYMTILSKSAAIFLLEQLKAIKDLGKDMMVKDFVSFIPPSKKPSRKYKFIWDLTILLNHIRLSPPIRDQTMNELIPRVVALLMIFTLTRPIEIFRMNSSSLTYSDNRTQVSILTHRKTDARAATSALSLLRLPENSICPVRYLEELVARARAYSSHRSVLSSGTIITL